MPAEIMLPKKIVKVLENSDEYAQALSIISTISPIYEDNRMYFFEEFTDHGLNHIQEVLNSSEDIISNSSYRFITARTALTYICSVLLHDIGMHLSLDGFKRLVGGCLNTHLIKDFDNEDWTTTWNKFLSNAKKYDEKQINNIFGENLDDEFIIPQPDINLLNSNNISVYDKKLIGEFIRINHARLAHESALGGFPGADKNIDILKDLDTEIKNIIGTIARSHNLAIRDTFSYLKKIEIKKWHSIYKIPSIYLMVLLRLSDLIQIHAGRADSNKLKYRRLNNPISIREWAIHQSIGDIYTNTENEDPESIYVSTIPKTSEIYLKVRDLIDYIQKELDTSWAVLGEVYSKISLYKNLQIKYRRINSNIDDINHFKNTINYIPKKVYFDTTRELQRLLIAPLYGNNPSFGVRELLQNSVDACRSREYFEKLKGNNFNPLINISIKRIDDYNLLFSIQDNGIGMTLDTVENYFLKAGASFRKSSTWKQDFVTTDGVTSIQRTGRFGVGALAVFLLGKKIKLTTKHVHDDSFGLSFESTLEAEQIEVIKTNSLPGTTIEIVLSSHASELLKEQYSSYGLYHYRTASWQIWYTINEPRIDIQVPEDWEGQPHINTLPSIDNEPSKNASAIYPKGFNKIVWEYTYGSINLICNGFIIPGGYKIPQTEYPSITKLPQLRVFDYEGNLPLTLNRNYLEEDYLPFEKDLTTDIYKDIITYALSIPIKKPKTNNTFINHGLLSHPAYTESSRFNSYKKEAYKVNKLVFLKNGYTFSLSHCLKKNNIKDIIQIWTSEINPEISTDKDLVKIKVPTDKYGIIFYNKETLVMHDKEISNLTNCFNTITKPSRKRHSRESEENELMLSRNFIIYKKNILINNNYYNKFKNLNNLTYEYRYYEADTERYKDYTLVRLSNKEIESISSEELYALDILSKNNPTHIHMAVVSKIESYNSDENNETAILKNLLTEYLGESCMIPYDLKQRLNPSIKEYKILKEKVDRHIRLREQENKDDC
ncbi:HD domain-containing protein [Hymenobacter chitinivorans]|nr:ATP-binding protein [Hymenobacter chitinivorans]